MTEDAAARLGAVADSLRQRGLDPHDVAHFLIRIVFCLFAEDVGLLPRGLFSQILDKSRHEPARFQRLMSQLWSAMATGGDFGAEPIKHFNGNLFDNQPPPLLTHDEIAAIAHAGALEWNTVDASIFGTLFTRGIDPKLRSQLGAEYTSRTDIETLIEPVVLAPLRRQWTEVRAKTDKLIAAGDHKSRQTAEKLIADFLKHLRVRRVLDASGGSGNFLYVTLQKLVATSANATGNATTGRTSFAFSGDDNHIQTSIIHVAQSTIATRSPTHRLRPVRRLFLRRLAFPAS